jgi:hypothetical protein
MSTLMCSRSLEALFLTTGLFACDHAPLPSKASTPVPRFSLTYGVGALGSNLGSMQPVLDVHGTHFVLTSKQSGNWSTFRDMHVDTLRIGTLPQRSIDSIIGLAEPCFGEHRKTNDHGIMSGAVRWLNVVRDTDTASFTMWNAEDTIASAIMGVLEPYVRP